MGLAAERQARHVAHGRRLVRVREIAVRLGPRGGSLAAPAVFDLNSPAHYVHWHFFQMSVANLVVIGLMIVVFIAAILIPFPKREIEE